MEVRLGFVRERKLQNIVLDGLHLDLSNLEGKPLQLRTLSERLQQGAITTCRTHWAGYDRACSHYVVDSNEIREPRSVKLWIRDVVRRAIAVEWFMQQDAEDGAHTGEANQIRTQPRRT